MSGKSKVECACVPSLDRQQLRGGRVDRTQGRHKLQGIGWEAPKVQARGAWHSRWVGNWTGRDAVNRLSEARACKEPGGGQD